MAPDKIKLTQQEFDDVYQIEEITGETEAETHGKPDKQDTTPFLTEEQQELDDEFASKVEWGPED